MLPLTLARWGALCALCLSLWSCGDDPKPAQAEQDAATDADTDAPDSAPDAPEDAPQDAPEDAPEDMPEDAPEDVFDPTMGQATTPRQEGLDPLGVDPGRAPAEGEAFAGVVREGTGGFGGAQATCGEGDLVLFNRKARFCVEGQVPSSQLFFDGGQLIDAEPADAPPYPGQTGRDRLDVMAFASELRTARGERVEVWRDGTALDAEHGAAVVRVEGGEEQVMYLAGVIGGELLRRRPIRVVTEYRLKPESRFLEIVSFATYEGTGAAAVQVGDLVFWGDTLEGYLPGYEASGEKRTALARGAGVAYGVFTEQPYQPLVLPAQVDLPAALVGLPRVRLEQGQTVAGVRWLGVAAHTADLLRELGDHPAAPEGEEGELRLTQGGAPLEGARVRVVRASDGVALWADTSDADGRVPLWVPAGEYRFEVSTREGISGQLVATLAQGAGPVTLEVPAPARLSVQVLERQGEAEVPAPARLVLRPVGGGEERVYFVARGARSVEVPPGAWSWELSRGSEFTYEAGQVEVTSGQEGSLRAVLERVVPTPGFVSGEFHQHATASLDSDVAVADRVLSNVAEGVDFAVSSDHDIVTDFGPVIEELGVRDLIASLTGTEVSPVWGHFGAYPMTPSLARTGRGALPLAFLREDGSLGWWEATSEMFPKLRDEYGARLIQVNHGRDGGSAYFSSFGWDRAQPIEGLDEGFSLDFDSMEVLNGEDCEQMQDWFALLNQGKRVIGVGNSDTHSVGKPPGYPRNYIPWGGSVEALTGDQIVDGVLGGDVVVSAIAYMEFEGEVRPGRLEPRGEYELNARVLTPPWARVDRLAVIRNGVKVDELEIGAAQGEVVDFDGPVRLEVEGEQDAWFILLAYSSTDERPSAVYPGRKVFAFSNPFYFDASGDGLFTPPGPGPIDGAWLPMCR